MLFNSIEFAVFLVIVFGIYWTLNKQNLRLQNLFILVVSYVFYGWWDYRFLSLIAFSTLVDYVCSIKIGGSDKPSVRKTFLWISILTNLGLLMFFKYFNFFIDSWNEAWAGLGYHGMEYHFITIILPVGISFYTFQTMSYTIDVYRGALKPTKDIVAFSAYVTFFPQLVAGPIERATNLLPQIQTPRRFNYEQSVSGLRLILWGLFKKIVIADTLAPIVDTIFTDYQSQPGLVLLAGAIFFSFQIYCDFSGYSDIAIGTSKLFGIELMSNFKFPYFSRTIAEFWRRWHISLSTWFRDYIYFPLGGSRVSKSVAIRNIFIIFLVSGFWHGANWTFIAWGAIHAFLYIPSFIFGYNRRDIDVIGHGSKVSFADIFRIILTYCLVTIAWIFFRAPSIGDAIGYIGHMFSNPQGASSYNLYYAYIVALLGIEWLMRRNERQVLNTGYRALNWAIYIVLILVIFLHANNSANNFIYFQF